MIHIYHRDYSNGQGFALAGPSLEEARWYKIRESSRGRYIKYRKRRKYIDTYVK